MASLSSVPRPITLRDMPSSFEFDYPIRRSASEPRPAAPCRSSQLVVISDESSEPARLPEASTSRGRSRPPRLSNCSAPGARATPSSPVTPPLTSAVTPSVTSPVTSPAPLSSPLSARNPAPSPRRALSVAECEAALLSPPPPSNPRAVKPSSPFHHRRRHSVSGESLSRVEVLGSTSPQVLTGPRSSRPSCASAVGGASPDSKHGVGPASRVFARANDVTVTRSAQARLAASGKPVSGASQAGCIDDDVAVLSTTGRSIHRPQASRCTPLLVGGRRAVNGRQIRSSTTVSNSSSSSSSSSSSNTASPKPPKQSSSSLPPASPHPPTPTSSLPASPQPPTLCSSLPASPHPPMPTSSSPAAPHPPSLSCSNNSCFLASLQSSRPCHTHALTQPPTSCSIVFTGASQRMVTGKPAKPSLIPPPNPKSASPSRIPKRVNFCKYVEVLDYVPYAL